MSNKKMRKFVVLLMIAAMVLQDPYWFKRDLIKSKKTVRDWTVFLYFFAVFFELTL